MEELKVDMFLVTSRLMSEVLVAETDEDALLNSRIKNRLVLSVERLNHRAVLHFNQLESGETRIYVEDYLKQHPEPHSVGIILEGESPLSIE